ncbi:hypothetical protein Tco_0421440 [Tanacetum coccineum]
MGHYMTAYPEISRRVRDKYHNLEHDEMVKRIFNSGKNKIWVGIKILSWMITDEMKLMENYQMTTSAPRSHNLDMAEGESSAQRKSTVIRFCILPRRSTRLTPSTSILNAVKVEDMVIQDTIQLSIAEKKSRDDFEAQQNVEKFNEHLVDEEIEKMVEGTKNESLEVEILAAEQPVNVIEEEEESAEDDYELRIRVKGKDELTKTDPKLSSSTPSSSSSKLSASQCLLSLFKFKTRHSKQYKSFFDEFKGQYGYLFGHLKTTFMPRKSFHELANHLQEVMQESLPFMVDSQVKEVTNTTVLVYVAEGLILERQKMSFAIRPRDQDDHHDDAYPEGENSAKRQKISEHGTYVIGESSSGQADKSNPSPSTSGNQEQLDDFDFWTDKYATDDDEFLAEKVSQEFVEEMSETLDEAKLHKAVDEIAIKEILSLLFLQKPTPVVQSCQRDHKAPALSLVNQDFLYLKKGNSGSKKFMLSLHKFPAVIFPDEDIEERTSRWNPNAKIFYIKRQREPGKPIEKVYSNSKFVQVIKTTGEFEHGHKFVTEIIVRRANERISSITEPDYKNLNKNDIKDMYLLCVNGKVDDYAETGLLWSLSVFIRSTNNKKEKRVMGHHEIHKFCDATLKRVLEGLKSYNNNVKHGYVTPSLSKDDAEYLQLFEEEIEERLKYRD